MSKTIAEFIIEEQAGIKDYEAAIAGTADAQARAVLEGILAQEREHVKALQALPENTSYQTIEERRVEGSNRYGEPRRQS